jgi:hypothetical protein
MQNDPPSHVTAASGASSDPPRNRIGQALAHARRGFEAAFSWPPVDWIPVPTVLSLGALALAIVLAVELLSPRIANITLSVHARTEAATLDLASDRPHIWRLPAGDYALMRATGDHRCESEVEFNLVCSAAGSTTVVISNGGRIEVETLPAHVIDTTGTNALAKLAGPAIGRLSLTISPRPLPPTKAAQSSKEPLPTTIEIRDATNRTIAATQDHVRFVATATGLWRMPLILEHVQIGESLTELTAHDTIDERRQPIMTAGDVRIFARGLFSTERYLVKEERFDPADVVQIPADRNRDGLLLGLISLNGGDPDFDLTLHTDFAEVLVERLGAAHTIRMSKWSILSRLPFWLALWVVFVSLIVIANYHAQRVSAVRGTKDAE